MPFGSEWVRDTFSTMAVAICPRSLQCLSAVSGSGTQKRPPTRSKITRCLQCLSAVSGSGTIAVGDTVAIVAESPMPFGSEWVRDPSGAPEHSTGPTEVSNAFRQ